MILTETQARKKACHKVLQPHPDWSKTDDREVITAGRCIASDCMAWCWSAYHTPEERRWRKECGIHVPDEPTGYCKAR